MNVPVGRRPKRVVKSARVNDCLPAAARQVRHWAAALLAEGGCKAAGLRQVEAR